MDVQNSSVPAFADAIKAAASSPPTTEMALRHAAYRRVLMDYKPWHQHGAWNSSGNDAFWQLIDGGIKLELFTVDSAARMFNESHATIHSWMNGEVPPRKTRINVWKKLKKEIVSDTRLGVKGLNICG